MSQQRPSADTDRKRRRVDEVFGELLPDVTSDERGIHDEGATTDQWYLENRPPHHER